MPDYRSAAALGLVNALRRGGVLWFSLLLEGALMKIPKEAIAVFLVAAAMLWTLPVHAKVSKPKQLEVTYYYLPT
jgi:hypothetical protein